MRNIPIEKLTKEQPSDKILTGRQQIEGTERREKGRNEKREDNEKKERKDRRKRKIKILIGKQIHGEDIWTGRQAGRQTQK